MDIAALQTALNLRGVKPPLATDGIAGKRTMAAVDEMLRQRSGGRGWGNWTDERRRVAAEQIIYQDAKIEVGAIDGLVGEQTRVAREVYLKRIPAGWREDQEKADKPITQAKTTWPRQADVSRFFGKVGENQVTLDLPYPMRIAWDLSKNVTRFSCHKLVHEPMSRIFKNTLDHYGLEEIRRLRLDMFGGCLNVRKMRGGSAWSMHSWGIAVDIDPDRNQLKWDHTKASLDDPPYKPFWEFVYAEGAIGLGRERDFDHMHWQFARL